MPKPERVDRGPTPEAPYLSEANWYQMLRGYWFFADEELSPEALQALRQQYAPWLEDLRGYAEGHPRPRLRDAIVAWAALRGIPVRSYRDVEGGTL